ncbi:MAG: hypothetical protein NZ455_04510 [Bacteroidia bacterium]|nr:hypothetical protein [Bacteroidia bacterium]
MRHAEGVSAVRSAAKHRSDSVARSTPTRSAAKGHAQNKISKSLLCIKLIFKNIEYKNKVKLKFICYFEVAVLTLHLVFEVK